MDINLLIILNKNAFFQIIWLPVAIDSKGTYFRNEEVCFFIPGFGCKIIDYKGRRCCLVDRKNGIFKRMFLPGPVLELSLFSVLAEVIFKNLPEQ
jgi:hypothetical protein